MINVEACFIQYVLAFVKHSSIIIGLYLSACVVALPMNLKCMLYFFNKDIIQCNI